jgi:hypothetical protein
VQGGAGGEAGPDSLQGVVEGALAETRMRVARGPEEVRVAEDERWLVGLLVASVGEGRVAVVHGAGADDAAVGEEDVENQLNVERPVAWVVEDEDGVDFDVGWVGGGIGIGIGIGVGVGERSGKGGVVVLEDVGEGPDGRVGGEDVAGHEDVLEAVGLGDLATLVGLAADHEDCRIGG